MTPLVSVLTPSFGQARWLEDNLRSVERQTYPAIEHVVMDGGSTDGSVTILEGRSRDRLIWASEPDGGQSDAINKAFKRSTGDIIGWLNSDDAYFSADVVASAVRIFEAQPEVGVVFGHAVLVNSEGTLLHVLWTPATAGRLVRAFDLICQPTVFIRRSALGRDALVDPAYDYMMDWELWLHLAGRTRFHRMDRIVAIDRHHLQRKSYTRPDLAALDRTRARARYRIVRWATHPLVLRPMKVAIRILGLRKVFEAARGSDVLDIGPTSRWQVAVRQVARRRASMPSGEPREAR